MTPREYSHARIMLHHLIPEARRFRRSILPGLMLSFLPAFTLSVRAEISGTENLFKTLGYLPKTELDKLEFDSALDKRLGGSKLLPEHYRGLLTAVRLSKDVFREGEPIPAIFVVKNLTSKKLGLDMRLDFHDFMTVNSVALHMLKGGREKEIGFGLGHMWACGGPPKAVIQPNGYYCVRGDLQRLRKRTFEPGDYTFFWDYARLRSNKVNFKVLPGDAETALDLSIPRLSALDYYGTFREVLGQDEHPDVILENIHIRKQWLGRLSAVLASGVEGRYYPDLLALPASDDLVRVSAQIVKEKTEGTSEISLKMVSLRDEPQVRLNGALHFKLLLKAESQQLAVVEEERLEMERGRISVERRLPRTFRLPLPTGWSNQIGFGGKAKLAVIVSSKPLRMERLNQIRSLARDIRAISQDGKEIKTWRGVLRSPFVPIVLAAAKAKADANEEPIRR